MVRVRRGNRVEQLEARRVEELLQKLGLLPEEVLVIRGGELLTRDRRLSEDDEVELRPVISRG